MRRKPGAGTCWKPQVTYSELQSCDCRRDERSSSVSVFVSHPRRLPYPAGLSNSTTLSHSQAPSFLRTFPLRLWVGGGSTGPTGRMQKIQKSAHFTTFAPMRSHGLIFSRKAGSQGGAKKALIYLLNIYIYIQKNILFPNNILE